MIMMITIILLTTDTVCKWVMLPTLRRIPHVQLTLEVRQLLSLKSQQQNYLNAVPASKKSININIVVINQLRFDMFWNSPYIFIYNFSSEL